MARPFVVVGHRGSPTVEVENTLPSFERAVTRDGANGLELDVCLTRERELVVWHDADPSGLEARLRCDALEPEVRCCPHWPGEDRLRRPVRDLALAEVQRHLGYAEKKTGARVDAHIPTLAEVFDWARAHPALGVIFLDTKIDASSLDLVAPYLARLDDLVTRARLACTLVVESAVPEVVRELRRLGARYPMALDVQPHPGLVLSTDGASAVKAALAHGNEWATAQKPRPVTLFPFITHKRIVAKDIRRMRALDARGAAKRVEAICAFTINDPDEMKTLIALGVDAIQTDRPDVLAEVHRHARARHGHTWRRTGGRVRERAAGIFHAREPSNEMP